MMLLKVNSAMSPPLYMSTLLVLLVLCLHIAGTTDVLNNVPSLTAAATSSSQGALVSTGTAGVINTVPSLTAAATSSSQGPLMSSPTSVPVVPTGTAGVINTVPSLTAAATSSSQGPPMSSPTSVPVVPTGTTGVINNVPSLTAAATSSSQGPPVSSPTSAPVVPSSPALRASSYRCLRPGSGRNDPACSLMGDFFTCVTSGDVVPYLSDGNVSTQYLWQGSSYLDLDIPNSVCLETIVMTFNKPGGSITLPTFTIEQSITFTTTYPSSPAGIGNTTITFSQQYCQPTIRINMTQAVSSHFIILLDVSLIQPVDSTGTAAVSVPPSSPSAATTGSSQGPPTSSPGVTSTRADLTIPLVAGAVAAGVVIIILLVVVVVIVGALCVVLKRFRTSPPAPSDTKDSVIYDHVDQNLYCQIKIDRSPVYQAVGTASDLDKNSALYVVTDTADDLDKNSLYVITGTADDLDKNSLYVVTGTADDLDKNPVYEVFDKPAFVGKNPAYEEAEAEETYI